MKSVTINLPRDVTQALHIYDNAGRRKAAELVAAGHAVAIRFCDQLKSRDQEEKYHAMIGEIAAQIGDDLADAEDAKRILISAFRIDTMREFADDWAKFGDMRMGRGLRGEVVLLGIQSRKFTTRLAAAFIEWLYAFGAEHGVVFVERMLDPRTGEMVQVRRDRPIGAAA